MLDLKITLGKPHPFNINAREVILNSKDLETTQVIREMKKDGVNFWVLKGAREWGNMIISVLLEVEESPMLIVDVGITKDQSAILPNSYSIELIGGHGSNITNFFLNFATTILLTIPAELYKSLPFTPPKKDFQRNRRSLRRDKKTEGDFKRGRNY